MQAAKRPWGDVAVASAGASARADGHAPGRQPIDHGHACAACSAESNIRHCLDRIRALKHKPAAQEFVCSVGTASPGNTRQHAQAVFVAFAVCGADDTIGAPR